MLKLLPPPDVQRNLPTILVDHATRFPVLDRCLHLRLLYLWSGATGLPLRVLLRRVDAGLGVGFFLVKSCGDDVGDELEDPVDDPGITITIGTEFSVLQCVLLPFLMRCGF